MIATSSAADDGKLSASAGAWDLVVLTRPVQSRLDSLQFSAAFRSLAFVDDLHAVFYTSKVLETRLLNGYLSVRRAIAENFAFAEEREDNIEEEEDVDEDEIMTDGRYVRTGRIKSKQACTSS